MAIVEENIDLDALTSHDMSDDCAVCKAQTLVDMALIPAVSAWEAFNELPRFSLALHGAAALLAVMLEEGVPRGDLDEALKKLVDEIEHDISEQRSASRH